MKPQPATPESPATSALLAEAAGHGLALSASELLALVDGVLAAPEPRDGSAWLRLVGEPLPAAAADLLTRAKAVRAAELAALPADPIELRVAALRAELASRGLEGFIVPRADEHQGEYVPANAERLARISGFDGSAGLVIVLSHAAALFTDGRYTLQAAAQVPQPLYSLHHITDDPWGPWLTAQLKPGMRFGFDPRLHTVAGEKRLRAAVERAGAALVATDDNPLDAVWTHRPAAPLSPTVPHDLAHAGRSAAEKRAEIAAALAAKDADATVLTQPDSIAWLLNIRGADVPNTPLPLSFAILHADGGRTELFIDPRKTVEGLAQHLGPEVALRSPEALWPALDALKDRRVLVDPETVSTAIAARLAAAGATLVEGADPCALPKATKNAAEQEGTRRAHDRDGLAVARLLRWLDGRVEAERYPTEREVAAELDAQRARIAGFVGPSFETISGSGPNGAIVHYRVTAASDRRLGPGELFLLDSGAQYPDGTTDITRTVAIGTPTEDMRTHVTLVLKGHIALSTQRFPAGTTGSQLDALARMHLWQAGLDFDHGTGHGVGSFLSVHEGPARISKIGNSIALLPGMILSNEPGYYRTGAYGIRLENLVMVQEDKRPGDERPMLRFETLTFAPFDRRLIKLRAMTAGEIDWLNRYHAAVLAKLSPQTSDAGELAWLKQACAPLLQLSQPDPAAVAMT